MAPPPAAAPDDRLRQLVSLGKDLVSELDLDALLYRIVGAAVDLTGAQYGALGVLDDERRALARFLTVGIDEEERRIIGDLPHGRGVLGVLIEHPEPLRLRDVGGHPESYGFPIGHPPMRSFLGAPIRVGGDMYGNLYLTEKRDAETFSDEDEETLLALAEWAAVAIANAGRFGGVSGQRNELERAVRAFETTSEISRALAGETDIGRILELLVKRSRALVGARGAVMTLLSGDDLVVEAAAGEVPAKLVGTRVPAAETLGGRIIEGGRSRRLDMIPSQAMLGSVVGARTAVLVPVRFRGRDLGVLSVFDRLGRRDLRFDADDERLLEAFALSAAPALATAQSVESLQLQRSLEAAERERTRWARELHDETLQDLAGIKTMLSAARRVGDASGLEQAVDVAIEQLQLGITGLRSLITDLRPAALDELGTEAALETLVRRLQAMSHLDVRLDVDLAYEQGRATARHVPDLEAGLYRIVQEALTNVVKHAEARTVVVGVKELDEAIDVTVADDGRGLPGGEGHPDGFGVIGMRERAALLGGSVTLGGRPGGGTVMHAVLPVQRRDQAGLGELAPPVSDAG